MIKKDNMNNMEEQEYLITLTKKETELILYLVGDVWDYPELHDKIVQQATLSEGHYEPNQNKTGKIAWIEGLLKTHFSDARKTITGQVLLPYFKNICGLNLEESLTKLNKWLDLCSYHSKDRTKLVHSFKRSWMNLRPEIKPLSFSKIKKQFGDGIIDE